MPSEWPARPRAHFATGQRLGNDRVQRVCAADVQLDGRGDQAGIHADTGAAHAPRLHPQRP
eukprot:7022386-Prymnesium_polylepis.2